MSATQLPLRKPCSEGALLQHEMANGRDMQQVLAGVSPGVGLKRGRVWDGEVPHTDVAVLRKRGHTVRDAGRRRFLFLCRCRCCAAVYLHFCAAC